MTLRLFLLLMLPGFAACSLADDQVSEVIVSVSIEEIRADSSLISNKDFVSTGQPDTEILVIAKEAGITTIVDLRAPNENRGIDEIAEVEALGMRYVSLPVAGGADVNFDNATALDKILAASDGPVLLHCASGNRVGALFALRESLKGASDDEALTVGKTAGLTRLEGVVKKRLESH